MSVNIKDNTGNIIGYIASTETKFERIVGYSDKKKIMDTIMDALIATSEKFVHVENGKSENPIIIEINIKQLKEV